MQIQVEKLSEEQRAKLREIEQRWRDVPPLRVAHGEKDAFEDWPIGDFGPDDEHDGETTWLTTNRVHASEHVLSSAEVCERMAHSRDDVRELFKVLASVLERLP